MRDNMQKSDHALMMSVVGFVKRRVFVRGYLDRLVADREVAKLLSSLPVATMDALEISGNGFENVGFKTYRAVHYPEFDICESTLPETFDIILAEQVWEHLLWPYRAGKNVYSMLRPGGYFLVMTPFLLKVHGYPVDCSRWTEIGMKYLLAECGFELDKIATYSWGNRMVAKANLKYGNNFAQYHPWLHRNFENDPRFPVLVWALARK
ncbi:MAG: class I SAM-dependent methyltransferase [Blastochloris sp.]|nr:class I SAM-dependent methyltransferase [Blastochloris sp.]